MQNSFREKDRAHLHITADKREIKDFPKLPFPTSFILKTKYFNSKRSLYLNTKKFPALKLLAF